MLTLRSPATLTLVAMVLLGLTSCRSGANHRPEEAVPNESTVSPHGSADPGYAPTPYTAEMIRDATPEGTEIVFESNTDEQKFTSHMIFESPTDDGVMVRQWLTRASKTTPPAVVPAKWAALRNHARFKADATKIEDYRLTTALGTFDTWRYEVTMTDEAGLMAKREFFFAKDLPGPPILFRVLSAGQVMSETRMIKRAVPSPESSTEK